VNIKDIEKKYKEFYSAGIEFCQENLSKVEGNYPKNGISPVQASLVKKGTIDPTSLLKFCHKLANLPKKK
jgi:hypothetical protein